MRKGMLVIISGPSGSGKGTVLKKLIREDFALSISMTTRESRPGEIDGKDYFFVTKEEFLHARDNGQLLEHAEFVGNMYGTPKKYVEERILAGRAVILEIDVEGALQIKDKIEESISIFLMPPSFEELSERLINRQTEDLDTIMRRIKRAKYEIEHIQKYDYLVINEDIEKTVSQISSIIDSEYSKPHRNKDFIDHIKGENYDASTIILRTNDNT
ncbi:MAG: guanylate kinase [Defluviitaleaceae bacterium]|nr:guanylate kinase [Defluviitaleaceae bacterium]